MQGGGQGEGVEADLSERAIREEQGVEGQGAGTAAVVVALGEDADDEPGAPGEAMREEGGSCQAAVRLAIGPANGLKGLEMSGAATG